MTSRFYKTLQGGSHDFTEDDGEEHAAEVT